MRIIPRYIMRDMLLTFVITLAVFTFVICTMVLFKVSEFIAVGGDGRIIAKIFLAGLPSAMGYSIPISCVTAALLVFGRLSANGEITAMKANGISMKYIIFYPALFGLLLSLFCLYLNSEITPATYHMRRQAIDQLGVETPLALIEEGRFIRDFPGMMFYVGTKKDNRIGDILIYQYGNKYSLRNIRAKSGTIRMSDDHSSILIDLVDVRIDPFYDDRPGAGHAKYFPLKLTLPRGANPAMRAKKSSDMTLQELRTTAAALPTLYPELEPEDIARQQMHLIVEFHRRLVMALSCLVFILLGAPLGTQTHRSESTAGVAMSLFLVFNFYIFIIIAKSMEKHPALHPYLICWIPIVLALGLSAYLVRRCD